MKNGSSPSDSTRQAPVDEEHRDTVLSAIARLLVTLERGVGDDRLDAADVVREPALDLAGPRLGEEPQRHPLEVACTARSAGPA